MVQTQASNTQTCAKIVIVNNYYRKSQCIKTWYRIKLTLYQQKEEKSI